LKKLLTIGLISVFLTACGGSGAVNQTANNPTNTNATTANTNTNVAPKNTANTSAPANATAVKPAETGPKRVAFVKGKTESTENITLAPGATTQFVLGATGAQNLFVTPGSKELTFKMLKGIGGEFIKADDGTYSAETKGNNAAKGDIVFEVKNPTAKEIKTTLKISIEDFGD
jgi:hypothetical protein